MYCNILIAILFSCSFQNRSSNDVFEISKATINENNEIKLSVKMTNKEGSTVLFYIPNMQDLCSNILQFYIIDKEGTQYHYDVCESDDQLDEIMITERNSKELEIGMSTQLDFQLNLSSFSAKLTKESIDEIKCVIDYPEANLVGSSNIYQKKIESKIKL